MSDKHRDLTLAERIAPLTWHVFLVFCREGESHCANIQIFICPLLNYIHIFGARIP